MKVKNLFEGRSTFTKGSGVFTCKVCKKQTRNVDGNANVGMCNYCYEESGLENELNDGHISREEYQKRIAELKKIYNRE